MIIIMKIVNMVMKMIMARMTKNLMAIMKTNVKMMMMMMNDEYCNLWRCSAGRVSTGSANGGWDTIHHPDPASLAL